MMEIRCYAVFGGHASCDVSKRNETVSPSINKGSATRHSMQTWEVHYVLARLEIRERSGKRFRLNMDAWGQVATDQSLFNYVPEVHIPDAHNAALNSIRLPNSFPTSYIPTKTYTSLVTLSFHTSRKGLPYLIRPCSGHVSHPFDTRIIALLKNLQIPDQQP
jgi:hypothetical protein